MFKYLLLILGLIFASLGGIYFFVGVPRINPTIFQQPAIPHLYNNPDIKIENIQIFAFYFVPKNKTVKENWRNTMESGLNRLQEFHKLQFLQRSKISYNIFPEPVIGEREILFYDTETTNRGNPQALINSSNEIERRVFRSDGNLFYVDFPRSTDKSYPVLFIMYEGVGASGGIINESGENLTSAEIAKKLNLPESIIYIVDVKSTDGFFLVNREILEGKHGQNGQSILAHEFYHTLGLSDEYSLEDASARSADIMGLGRFKPIENTYISKKLMASLGL